MIKACIFDLDGTIINTSESLRYSVSETMKCFGYPELDKEHTMSFVGNGGRNLIRRALALNGNNSENDLEKAHAIYKRIFKENCTRDNSAYAGMPEVLAELKKMGMKLAVISNKSQSGSENCVSKVYGKTLFDLVYGERPGVPLKPDPAGISALIEELNLKPEECLYVGDGETDMQGGNAAGCTTVGVTWGYRSREILEENGADYLIDDPKELLYLLTKMQ